MEDEPEPKNRDDPNYSPVNANRQVDRLVAVRAGEDSERDPHEAGDQHATDRKLHGGREPNTDLVPYGLAVVQLADRDPEISREHVLQVRDVLHRDRLVEAQLLAGRINRALRRLPTSPERQDRISRKDSKDNEDRRQENQQHGDGQEHPRQDVT